MDQLVGKYTGKSNYLSHLLLLDVFRKYRFIADKQLTWWCWGWLGRHNRVCLPSCAVKKLEKGFLLFTTLDLNILLRHCDLIRTYNILLDYIIIKQNNMITIYWEKRLLCSLIASILSGLVKLAHSGWGVSCGVMLIQFALHDLTVSSNNSSIYSN